MIYINDNEYTLEKLQALIVSINVKTLNKQQLTVKEELFLEYVDAAVSFDPMNYDQDFPFIFTVDELDSAIERMLILDHDTLKRIGYNFKSIEEYEFVKTRLWLKQYFITLVFSNNLDMTVTSDQNYYNSSKQQYDFRKDRMGPDRVSEYYTEPTVRVRYPYWRIPQTKPDAFVSMDAKTYMSNRLRIQYIIGDLSSADLMSRLGFYQAKEIDKAFIGAYAMSNENAFKIFIKYASKDKHFVSVIGTLLSITRIHNLSKERCNLLSLVTADFFNDEDFKIDDETLKKSIICDPLSDVAKYVYKNKPELAFTVMDELRKMMTSESNEQHDLIFSIISELNPSAIESERDRMRIPPRAPGNTSQNKVPPSALSMRKREDLAALTGMAQCEKVITLDGKELRVYVPLSKRYEPKPSEKSFEASATYVKTLEPTPNDQRPPRHLSKVLQGANAAAAQSASAKSSKITDLERQIRDAEELAKKREKMKRLHSETSEQSSQETMMAAQLQHPAMNEQALIRRNQEAINSLRNHPVRPPMLSEQERIRRDQEMKNILRDRPENLGAAAAAAWDERRIEEAQREEQKRKEEEEQKRKEEREKKRKEREEEMRMMMEQYGMDRYESTE